MQIKGSILFTIAIIFIFQTVFSQIKTIPEIVKQVEQSVVVIYTYDKEGNIISQGRGFFISHRGDIITNRYVLLGANRVDIKTTEAKVYPAKKILAEDKESDLVKISVDISTNVIIPLSIATTLSQVGDQIVVIGNPLGLAGTVTNGIISAIREVPFGDNIFQITAPISPGSSGSPVVNMSGNVIGVASFQIV